MHEIFKPYFYFVFYVVASLMVFLLVSNSRSERKISKKFWAALWASLAGLALIIWEHEVTGVLIGMLAIVVFERHRSRGGSFYE